MMLRKYKRKEEIKKRKKRKKEEKEERERKIEMQLMAIMYTISSHTNLNSIDQ